ncbi:MAG: hypothetical protein IKR09_01320 [Alphaproteobacteria bacterium]|nr:hypothetical protein [Alphaproteobacteria bacterium]
MTVSTTTNKVAYIGNGVATSFAIPFPFLEREHLKVRQLLNNVQTERTDWTVSGGNMVFATAPANDAQIVIMREVPLTQETDYRENEILPAETLERNFDRLTMQVQQLKEQADRAVTVDIFDDTDAASLIPSIRQAVSDCAEYTATASDKADIATDKAEIATNKAVEAQHTLSSKTDVDLNNLTTAGKENLAEMLMPDYSRKVVLSANVTYTAACAGVFCGYYRGTSGTGTTYTVNGFTQTYSGSFDNAGMPTGASFFVFVSKGESYSAARANNLYFIPLKGVAA